MPLTEGDLRFIIAKMMGDSLSQSSMPMILRFYAISCDLLESSRNVVIICTIAPSATTRPIHRSKILD